MHPRGAAACAAMAASAMAASLAVGCTSQTSDDVGPQPDGAVEAADAFAGDALADAARGDARDERRDDGSPDGNGAEGGDASPSDAPDDGYDGGLWVNDGACDVGEIGAVFRGVPAYCQPSSATGYYQCDELANRFMRDALLHPELDNVVTDYASSICAHAAAMPSDYTVYGPGYVPSGGHAPVPGDLLVLNGAPGHVAVIVGFADPTD